MKYFTLSQWRALKDPLNAGPHNLLNYGNYSARTKTIKMITLHITVSPDGDSGAASTTRYGMNTSTPASWMVCVGNSRIYTGLPLSKSAWTQGVSGFDFNQRGWGIEIAKMSTKWGQNPSVEDGLLRMAAAACAPVVIQYGIPIRLERNRATISREINAGRAVGFTYHADLDPSRRSDPGLSGGKDTFPLAKFLQYVREEVAIRKGSPAPSPTPTPTPPPSGSALYKVIVSALNVRSGPGMGYRINTVIRDRGTYTIVEEKSGWGRLKSGRGWISLGSNLVTRLSGSTPAPAPAPSPTVLKRGSTGTAVRNLQSGLNRVFPLYSKLAVDGSFGPATEAVIREFQKRAKLAVDGVVGSATKTALAKYGVKF